MIGDIQVIFIILQRGKADNIIEFLREECKLYFNLVLLGNGTAVKELEDMLGLGDSKKEIVLTAASFDRVTEVLKAIEEKFEMDKAGNGVAFTVGLSSLSGSTFLKYIMGK